MTFWLIISIFFGLIFGSFWSVILTRRATSESLKQASSIISWRSQCPYCKTTLQAWDLIPLLSFLFQWGKCRYCKKKISWFYPILELGSAIVFWFVRRYFQDQTMTVVLFWMATGWVLWLMVVYSVLRYEIHIPLLFLWVIILFIALLFGMFPYSSLWWGLILFLIFLVLYFVARQLVRFKYHLDEDWMWLWDIITSPYLWTLLFAGLHSWVGGLDKTLAVLYFLIISGIIGLVWYALQSLRQNKRARRFLNAKIANQSLPLLPSMVMAVVIILIFQDTLFWLFMF